MASARKTAAVSKLSHNPGPVRNSLGGGLVSESMDMLVPAGRALSGPPPSCPISKLAKYEVLNAIFSNTPIAIGGSVAHKIGNRRAHADTSSNQA